MESEESFHLEILKSQPVHVIADFCKLAWDYFSKGSNDKLYSTVAAKLEVDTKLVSQAVLGLCQFFLNATKLQKAEHAFREPLTILGFNEEQIEVFFLEYQKQEVLLPKLLESIGSQHSWFNGLEWRFQVEVASKCLKHQIEPKILLKLNLKKRTKTENVVLQSNIRNIIHLNEAISNALSQSRSQYARKVQKAVS